MGLAGDTKVSIVSKICSGDDVHWYHRREASLINIPIMITRPHIRGKTHSITRGQRLHIAIP